MYFFYYLFIAYVQSGGEYVTTKLSHKRDTYRKIRKNVYLSNISTIVEI